MKFSFLIQARMTSTRLPGKVLKPVYDDITLLELIYKRVLLSEYANTGNVYVLITENKQDDVLAEFLENRKIPFFRGSEQNVYDRFLSFILTLQEPPDYFFRICSDNPFIEPLFITGLCRAAINQVQQADYLSYISVDQTPVIQKKFGLFAELIKTSTFIKMASDITTTYNQEHVTPFLYQSGKFKLSYLPVPEVVETSGVCFSVDTEVDLLACRQMLQKIGKIDFSYNELIKLL